MARVKSHVMRGQNVSKLRNTTFRAKSTPSLPLADPYLAIPMPTGLIYTIVSTRENSSTRDFRLSVSILLRLLLSVSGALNNFDFLKNISTVVRGVHRHQGYFLFPLHITRTNRATFRRRQWNDAMFLSCHAFARKRIHWLVH